LREILPLCRRGVSHAIPACVTALSVFTLTLTNTLYDLKAADVVEKTPVDAAKRDAVTSSAL